MKEYVLIQEGKGDKIGLTIVDKSTIMPPIYDEHGNGGFGFQVFAATENLKMEGVPILHVLNDIDFEKTI